MDLRLENAFCFRETSLVRVWVIRFWKETSTKEDYEIITGMVLVFEVSRICERIAWRLAAVTTDGLRRRIYGSWWERKPPINMLAEKVLLLSLNYVKYICFVFEAFLKLKVGYPTVVSCWGINSVKWIIFCWILTERGMMWVNLKWKFPNDCTNCFQLEDV